MKKIIIDKRVPGGKTLSITATIDDKGVLRKIKITGDFFAYPEEEIDRLEEALVNSSCVDIDEKLEPFRHRLEIVGVSFLDIAELIKEILCSNT